jgi:putative sterol carrier protein
VLNSDERYAQVARNWEGDVLFILEPDAPGSEEPTIYYMDLWHGSCRQAFVAPEDGELPEAEFSFRASISNFKRVLAGDLDPMQALLTRKLKLDGSFAYLMRNVPVVLDFVRCGRRVGIEED